MRKIFCTILYSLILTSCGVAVQIQIETKATEESTTINTPENDPYSAISNVNGWIMQIGDGNLTEGTEISMDPSGNIFITGIKDSGTICNNDDPYDNTQLYVSKVSNDGSTSWTNTYGDGNCQNGMFNEVNSIDIDSEGNAYILGDFEGSQDFAEYFNDNHTFDSGATSCSFITKINYNNTYGDTTDISCGTSWAMDLHIDSTDSINVVGYFNGLLSEAGVTPTGSTDSYLLKYITTLLDYDDNTFGGTNVTSAIASASDSYGDQYILGSFTGTTYFKPGDASEYRTSQGYTDISVTKVYSNGTYGWTKSIGGANIETPVGIAIDSDDNIYILGTFEGTVDFAYDFSSPDEKTSAGGADIFITKINSDLSYGWTKVFGNSGDDNPKNITIDSSGNIYIVGSFQGTADFSEDFSGSDEKTSNGSIDAFVTKINSDDSYGWTRTFGGTGEEIANSVISDDDYLYVAGTFSSIVDFDYTSSVNYVRPEGVSDAFIIKMEQ